MADRPILMSAPMVRAILSGVKNQTRRLVKPQPPANTHKVLTYHHSDPRPHFFAWVDPGEPSPGAELSDWCQPCPYGQPGDRLWVRETWAAPRIYDRIKPGDITPLAAITYPADQDCTSLKLRPAIHMPRWATRIRRHVVSVHVERLQDISEADAIDEGAPGGHSAMPGYAYNATPIEHYKHIWEQINGPDTWAQNPWVWVIKFQKASHT